MIRVPVPYKFLHQKAWVRANSSSTFIRSTFLNYFETKHGHKRVKSSSVVPLYDPSVPFVNAGMNQFKSVFLGTSEPPCPRAVNSQKCIRVGGKHNDLEVVGTDGTHHTFFEMLGNWSFGDYYKKEACQMAWDLLLGPYRLKPENLAVTYFGGDYVLDLPEDRECRDIWLSLGVPKDRVVAKDITENFWEMGSTGPCGPCTEIHYIRPDGHWTEIWNIVFINCKREETGKVVPLGTRHVDTGMGLERMAALLQGARCNYDTDLFRPLLRAIEENSTGVEAYGGTYGTGGAAWRDAQYRRLADHARMTSVCLADGVFPATSLNLKQIIRKAIKISTVTFNNPKLLLILYDQVMETLGATYPELVAKQKEAKCILETELESYAKLRSNLRKKFKDLHKLYPEVEAFNDIESAGFAQGYKEFKETMAKLKSKTMPGELVFKLYDTHGLQEDQIQRIAKLNDLQIDTKGFWTLLKGHKAKHKTALKEQMTDRGTLFEESIATLKEDGYTSTDDKYKYDYTVKDNEITFPTLKTKLICLLNNDLHWLDISDPSQESPYYIVTEKTNFYCEEGGQASDEGTIKINDDITFEVNSVFKIRDFVFHKGYFKVKPCDQPYVRRGGVVELSVCSERRLGLMRNHSAAHLLHAAVRRSLPAAAVCPLGARATPHSVSLSLSLYGAKLTPEIVSQAQELVRETIKADAPFETRVIDSKALANEENVLKIPGECYPETGIRLVSCSGPLESRELCCGTHVSSAGAIGEFVVTSVKGAGGNSPVLHALTGPRAAEVRELFCRTEKLEQVIDLMSPQRKEEEISTIRLRLSELCAGGAPAADYARCLSALDALQRRPPCADELALQSIAEEEVRTAISEAQSAGRRFVVHFLRCSYLMQQTALARALQASAPAPALVLGCAGGVIVAAATVPEECQSSAFSAEQWLSCILPVFRARLEPAPPHCRTYAQMAATKVSLITCEQQVQDAMRVAIKYAQAHAHAWDARPSEDRRHN